MFFHWIVCAASLKNIGDKTAGLFDRKKKEMSDLASEKASEAQSFAEEQARKAEEALDQTKKGAADLLDRAGELKFRLYTFNATTAHDTIVSYRFFTFLKTKQPKMPKRQSKI